MEETEAIKKIKEEKIIYNALKTFLLESTAIMKKARKDVIKKHPKLSNAA